MFSLLGEFLHKADIISPFHQMYFLVNLSSWVKIIFTLDYVSSCLILFLFEMMAVLSTLKIKYMQLLTQVLNTY